MQRSRMTVAPPERLERRAASRRGRADGAKRAQLILQLAAGQSYRQIIKSLDCSQNYIVRWKSRFLQERMGGLYARPQGRQPAEDAARIEAKILDQTRRGPADGSTHWSTRKLARKLGVSHNKVARVWARAGLQPHRLRRYMASDDPDFEAKATDIIGLYLKPPANAAVFCVDERAPFRRSIAWTPSCRSRRAEPNDTALKTRCLGDAHRSDCRPDRSAPDQCRICRLSGADCGPPACRSRHSHYCRQSLGP